MSGRCPSCDIITGAEALHLDSCAYHGTDRSAVVFSTSAYRKHHGTSPCGSGDWAFSLDGRGPLWLLAIPFADAKAEALRRAHAIGARTVEVRP